MIKNNSLKNDTEQRKLDETDVRLKRGTIMNFGKPETQTSPLISLFNFLGISLLASAGVSAILIGIVLLLSIVS
jgi:hypothetical protein